MGGFKDGGQARTLGLQSIVAICLAAMTGSCLILPGPAFGITGSSAALAIVAASTIVIGPLMSKAELSTAMPLSGGEFVFFSQAFGPLIGSILGVGLLCSMLLKAAFALYGFSYYLQAMVGELDPTVIKAMCMGLLFCITIMNLCGLKKLKKYQKNATLISTVFLFGLALVAFSSFNKKSVSKKYFFKDGEKGFAEAIGFVYMGFAGLTKISAMAGEVKKPGTNLPRGMFLSLFVMFMFFGVGTFAITSTVDLSTLKKDYAPYHSMAVVIGGDILGYITASFCILTNVGMANVALAAVARFPYAMSRDGLIPPIFEKTLENESPHYSILFSSFLMAICIWTLDVKKVAKLGSSFQLIIFLVGDVAVIVYRECQHSEQFYKPDFRSPYYPWVQWFGIISQTILLVFMGVEGLQAVAVFVILGSILYLVYGRHHSKFLGIWQLEAMLGILPDKFQDPGQLKKEMREIAHNPLHHYDLVMHDRLQAKAENTGYTKKYEAPMNKESRASQILSDPLLKGILYVHRVCITGGKFAKKLQGVDHLAKKLTNSGYDVYAIPQLNLTMQNMGVVPPKADDTLERQMTFWEQLLRTQIHMERMVINMATTTGKPAVIIVDRGGPDIKSYVPQLWDKILEATDTDEKYLMNRYDMILHFVTKKELVPALDRTEEDKEALAMDYALRNVYASHHRRVMVENQAILNNRLDHAAESVMEMLREAEKNVDVKNPRTTAEFQPDFDDTENVMIMGNFTQDSSKKGMNLGEMKKKFNNGNAGSATTSI